MKVQLLIVSDVVDADLQKSQEYASLFFKKD